MSAWCKKAEGATGTFDPIADSAIPAFGAIEPAGYHRRASFVHRISMQAICGFFRLDGAPARAEDMAHLRVAQVYNLARNRGRFDGWIGGSVALGTAAWGGRASGGDDSPVARHAETGCVVVADTRLDACAALARKLDLPRERHVTQAELVLHAWLRWGEDCAEKLRGDFAFAVWDPRGQRLYCARDIMGVRPLNVHCQPGRLFAFSSRAQALLTLHEVPPELDEGRIADALVQQLEGIDKTSTFYTAVKRLPPAHFQAVGPDHGTTRRYWQLEPSRVALPRGDKAWAETLTAALEQAVAGHLDGAARVGSMVSGGMDSSALAVIAADQLVAAGKGPLPTFSSVDSETGGPETAAALAMAKIPGFQPILIEPATIAAARAEFEAAIEASDEPFDATMLLLHAQYRAAALAGVDALLDGLDADALFNTGGTLLRQFRHLHWLGLWRNAAGYRQLYPYPGWSIPRQLARAARGALLPDWLRCIRQRPRAAGSVAQVRNILSNTVIAPAFAAHVQLGERLARLADWGRDVNTHSGARESQRAFGHPYAGCGLERYHRVAAWHGVDPRHPLEARAVLELCVNLPDRQRMRDGYTKACLREAMRGRLPESVRTRRNKQHLGWALTQRLLLPDQASVRQALAGVRPLLVPYVDVARLDAAFVGWRNREAAPGEMDIFAALALGRWLRRNGPARLAGATPPSLAAAAAAQF